MSHATITAMMSRLTQSLLFLCLLFTAAGSQAVERVTYYHNDALGSPVAATDASGTLLWREEYAPYGERLTQEPASSENTAWYTGKQEESTFGISYFGARWYDPAIGRFMAVDPVGFSPDNINSFSKYAYANNNPYVYVDPDGRESYLVGRPLGLPFVNELGSHNFIVSNARYIGDGGATVTSYGKNENGNTGLVDSRTKGFSEGTSYSDREYWLLLRLASDGEQNKSVSKIPASDATVDKYAGSLRENTSYNLVGAGGTNSNGASSAVANRSSGTKVPLPTIRKSSPGAQSWRKIQFNNP